MLGSVFFHPTCYKKQMQIEFALLRGCSRVVIKELYVEERIFLAVLCSVFFFPPKLLVCERVSLQLTLSLWSSRERSHAIILIALHVQFIPAFKIISAQSVWFFLFFWVGGQIVQFKHRHSQWGICHWENSRGGLVFMEYSVIRASSNSNIKLQVFFLF